MSPLFAIFTSLREKSIAIKIENSDPISNKMNAIKINKKFMK